MCQLSINNPIEAIILLENVEFIDFPAKLLNAGSNLHKLVANHAMTVFVNQKSLICSPTDCKT